LTFCFSVCNTYNVAPACAIGNNGAERENESAN
jgi:hypothetical protein